MKNAQTTPTALFFFVKMLAQTNGDNFAPLLFTSSFLVAAAIAYDTGGLIITTQIFLN